MKLKLLLLLLFLTTICTNAQTDCSLDETKFTGTFTTTEVGGTKIKASDATSNYRFGERVAIDGNIAVTVSRTNGVEAGKVYIFTNDGAGNWTQQTTLTASDGFAGDNFGSSVAIEGNYVIVGASAQTNTSGIDTGAAYLFEYNGVDTWTEVAIFEPSDGSSGDRYGVSVSIEGDLVLVGARDGCTGGCAYVYENDGTNTFTYTETKLEPQVQSGYSGARFGHDVLVKNGRAYVGGLYDYSSVGNASAGSVQIWDQANDGSWSRTHRLRGTETSEAFGASISVDGDYLAIGAFNYEISTTAEADQGRVYVYKADGNGDYLDSNRVMIQNIDKDSFTDQRFGTDVVIENGFLYVGTWGDGNINGDAVYIFKDDGTNTWSQLTKLTSGGGWDEFSNRAVAVSHPYLLIGQNEDDSPSNSGAIHFVPLASTITPTASVTEVTEALIGQNNATITLNFSDEATRTEIQFSIDGGTTFPYIFNDDALTGEITNLRIGSYGLKARYNAGSCVLDLGTITINQAAYTAIPDTAFEAELESQGYDDISGDGQVPTVLIESLTILNISNVGIADLTGIEDFIALEELKANGNDLTAINLTNNTALKVLWIRSGNNNFSSIDVGNNTALEDFRIQYSGTSLDISNNTALTQFMCTDCSLTSLNTSTNTNLTSLDLENSDITTLDLSTNINLTGLEIDGTSLVELDLSKNIGLRFLYAENITTLTGLNLQNGANTNIAAFETVGTPVPCVKVDDATYSANNWTDVDIATTFRDSGYCLYTRIPDANFEAALEALGYDDISSDGQVPTTLIEAVTTLDVSNKSISDVTGIEDFKALQVFECQSNNLTTLNISNNTALIELTANANNINSIDLSQNTVLETLIIGANDLTSIDISNNKLLKRLDILYNDITSLDTSNNPDLATLKAYNTDVVSYDFSNNPLLQNVQLYNNSSLTSLDVSNLTQLDQLRLDNTGITDLDVSNNLNLRIIRVNQSNINKLDLSNQSSLIHVYVDNSPINFLNVQNGNNTNFAQFHADNTPNLNCVVVDDAAYSTTNWTNIDGTMSFSDTYCNYTAIPDANFEAALYALGYDDIANDGQVPTALVAPVTTLDLINQSIGDLTGIEDFAALINLNLDTNVLTSLDLSNNTNLQTLNFDNNSIANLNLGTISNLTSIEGRYNQLTTIDVSQNSDLTFINLRDNLFTTVDVSNNPLLETINLRGNSNLTSIDISNNPNLKFLYFQDTALTGLDVSQNLLLEVIVIERVNFNTIDVSNLSALTQLRIADNSFTHLDVSKNPALVRLECENNDLIYLNLKNGNNTNIPNTDFVATGNPSLSCIIVDNATWSAANWTNIDGTATFTNTFCRYTAITDTNFEAELEALGYDDISGDGQVPTPLIEVLSSLDVDGKNINDLTGIEDFVALTYLNCNGNNLTTIDITQNIQLTYFNAAQNNISTVDLSNNTLLESLYLFSNNLSTIDLSNNTGLKQLYIQRNTNLPNFDISNNILLEEIDCSETNITALNTTNNTLLRNLEANDSPISSLDLSTNTALELLRLFTTNITVLDLTNNTSLKELRINDTGIQSLDLRNQVALTTMNAKDANLSYLNMQNGNNTNVASYLFNVTNNPNLSCVLVDDTTWSTTNWTLIDATTSFSDTYCDYTSIPDSIFEARLEALGYDDISGDGQVPTALIEVVTSLTLNDLGINDATGIEDFAALVTLNARGNNFTTLDVSQNTLLEHLYINSNSLSSIDVSKNVLLRNLNIGSNAITSLDLSNNPDLRDLWVQGNGGLTTLDLSNNLELRELYTYSSGVSTLDLSIHTELRILSAYRTSLASIDLSNNIELRALRVDETDVTVLDLSNNTKLETLRVNNTEITSLDLSNNTAFKQLWAHDTGLSNLNVRNGNNTNVTTFEIENNPDLNCVLVDDSSYSTTNWTNIDDTTNFTDTNYCNYTAIPDANFEAELFALGYDDTANDGQVPTALIEVVEDLTIVGKSIANLTGIEDFTALKTLNCASNTFTTLDLSNNTELISVITKFTPLTTLNISNSPNLDTLVCSFNDLSTLDVSNNTALTYLECNNNNLDNLDIDLNTALLDLRCGDNNLTALDVSNNILLTSIWCQNNVITELDFTNQTGLISITVNDNSLTSLDIRNGNNSNVTNFIATGNSNLTCISVDDATYSTTNWLGVDDAANFTDNYCRYTTIPDANFEARLEALGYDDISGDGQVPTSLIEVVTTLDASNKSITDFTGIEDFVGLTSLNVGNNQTGSIDVSNLTLLEYLRVTGMQLTSLDLTQNKLLTELECTYNRGITSIDLTNNVLLEKLNLSNNGITGIDVSHLTELERFFMKNNTGFDFLDIRNGNNTKMSFTDFDISNNSSLKCVLVDNVNYSNNNWFYIDFHTSFNANYCRYTSIPDANFEAALEALGYDNTTGDGRVPTALIEEIATLDVSDENIADLTGIEDFISLVNLDVSGNTIGSLDMSNSPNLSSLKANSCGLTELDITQNIALFSVSANSNQLTSLDTANNTGLESVVLYGNLITALDFTNNTALDYIDVFQNQLTQLDLSTNTQLEFLYCDNNNITKLDLRSNTQLVELSCQDNSLKSLNVQNGNNTNFTQFNTSNNAELTCITVDNVAYSITNWTNTDDHTSFNEVSCDLYIDITVFLEGAFTNPNSGEESLMRDDLRVGTMLPTTSPYSDNATISDAIKLDDAGSDAMVDWIWVELRDANDPSIIVAQQSGILQRDGDIVATTDDRSTPLAFSVSPGNYYIVVKHRNHLNIMSSSAISLSSTTATVDFTSSTNIAGGANAVVDMNNGIVAMISGDFDENGQIQNSDINSVIQLLGGSGYHNADIDMNGQIQNIDVNNLMNPNVGKGEQF
ncbi:hypothetical protein GCM10009430_02110 [Aquimarina litoralis]|uniref:Por secretion system C-terminal sorting domain-containing protein n=1 Tax=Aquimarina litoralis TaxID=584605 RepID=A0ABP3TPJ4_9FLAO